MLKLYTHVYVCFRTLIKPVGSMMASFTLLIRTANLVLSCTYQHVYPFHLIKDSQIAWGGSSCVTIQLAPIMIT